MDAQAGRLLARALNHLLAQEPWALRSLRDFAGRVVRFDLTPLQVNLAIQPDGQVAQAAADAEPAVTVAVPLSAMPAILADYANAGQAGVMKHVRLEGDAELANTVSLLVRHLRWEVAEDLSRVVGDVAAQRVVSGAGRVHQYALQTVRDLRDSVAEFLTDERPTLVRQLELERLSGDVAAVRNDLARLEKRLERLERARTSTNVSTTSTLSEAIGGPTPHPSSQSGTA